MAGCVPPTTTKKRSAANVFRTARASVHVRAAERGVPRAPPSEGETPTVVLVKRGVERWQKGHPWIYRADLAAEPKLEGGEVVRVTDHRGWFLGQAFYSATSKIALRWLTFEDEAVDRAFFRSRLEQADALRRRLFPGQRSYRMVHGESDLLPGLIVDRYGDFLSIQLLNQAMEKRKGLVAELLADLFRPRGIVNRSDVNVRTLEGLKQEKELLAGELDPTVPYSEGAIRFEVDLLTGQKTGAFLDQRENHLVAAAYAEGEALDCFSYVGGFALQLATRAQKVTAVEISEAACAQLKANALANGLKNIEVVNANAFDFLRDAVDEGKKFDTVVLDPPSFAKNKDAIASALRGYKELNLRAIQLLRPGGTLITASCTYHVGEEAFEELITSAAVDAKRRVQILERRGASRDHPVLLSLKETRYLKCFVARVL